MLVPIIISSCDAYRDAWDPFFTLFFKYWRDYPGPTFLLSNHTKFLDARVNNISVGMDRGWATNLKMALALFDADYIVYLQEDYFLTNAVDNSRISDLIDYSRHHNVACLRLYPSPAPDETWSSKILDIGKISRDAPYRVSLQASIWNKNIFDSLIVDGESGWDMEINGSIRSKNIPEPFLSVSDLQDPALPYLHRTAIVKGYWTVEAIELCRREGIPLDTSKRPIGRPLTPTVAQISSSFIRRVWLELRRKHQA